MSDYEDNDPQRRLNSDSKLAGYGPPSTWKRIRFNKQETDAITDIVNSLAVNLNNQTPRQLVDQFVLQDRLPHNTFRDEAHREKAVSEIQRQLDEIICPPPVTYTTTRLNDESMTPREFLQLTLDEKESGLFFNHLIESKCSGRKIGTYVLFRMHARFHNVHWKVVSTKSSENDRDMDSEMRRSWKDMPESRKKWYRGILELLPEVNEKVKRANPQVHMQKQMTAHLNTFKKNLIKMTEEVTGSGAICLVWDEENSKCICYHSDGLDALGNEFSKKMTDAMLEKRNEDEQAAREAGSGMDPSSASALQNMFGQLTNFPFQSLMANFPFANLANYPGLQNSMDPASNPQAMNPQLLAQMALSTALQGQMNNQMNNQHLQQQQAMNDQQDQDKK